MEKKITYLSCTQANAYIPRLFLSTNLTFRQFLSGYGQRIHRNSPNSSDHFNILYKYGVLECSEHNLMSPLLMSTYVIVDEDVFIDQR